MQVKDIMSRDLRKVSPDAMVSDVARLVVDTNERIVFVVEDSRLLGIVTEIDIIDKVINKGMDPLKTKVADIMMKSVISIGPGTSIEDAAKLMSDKKIRKLPVVSGGGLLGVITTLELVAAEPKIVEIIEELVAFSGKSKQIAG